MDGWKVVAPALAVLVALHPPICLSAQDSLPTRPPFLPRVWNSLSDTSRAWVRPLASLAVPGTGQLLAGQERGLVYLAAETYLVARFLTLRGEGRREADRFRDLAFRVARARFAGSRRDTIFEYYEQMERFRSSGSYDDDPSPLFLPEQDPTTYNGSVWVLARQTFWANPDSEPPVNSEPYLNAVSFYRARAVGPDFLWSWQNADLERQLFGQTIRRSDEAFRRAGSQLGLLLANHVVSAIDAFVSRRLSRTLNTTARLETVLHADGGAPGGVVLLSISVSSPH
jgi:hypothetical protein